MDIEKALKGYSFAIMDLSPHTQTWYKQKLKVFRAWCEAEEVELGEISSTDVQRFLAFIKSKPNEGVSRRDRPHVSDHTLHGYAQVIKGFLAWCEREDYITERQSRKIKQNVSMPKVEEKVIEIFSPEQIKRLFAACGMLDDATLAVRNRAILSLLLDTGIRASELRTLTLDRTDLSAAEPFVRVIGKGRKQREVGFGNKCRQSLYRYISRFRKPKDPRETHVFLGRLGQPMGVDGIDQMLYSLRDLAGIEGVRCSAHTFRHTFAVNFLLGGGDLFVLSRMLGHSTVSTTEIYLKAVKQRQIRSAHRSVLDSLI